jgi:hypothetical protein
VGCDFYSICKKLSQCSCDLLLLGSSLLGLLGLGLRRCGGSLLLGLLGLLIGRCLSLLGFNLSGFSLLLGDDSLDGLLLLEEESSLDAITCAVHASRSTISASDSSVGLCESLVLERSKAWHTDNLSLAVTTSGTLGCLLDHVESEATTGGLDDLGLVRSGVEVVSSSVNQTLDHLKSTTRMKIDHKKKYNRARHLEEL